MDLQGHIVGIAEEGHLLSSEGIKAHRLTFNAEGCFRRHWLLVESLRIYTELCFWPYLGPKKALSQLEKKDRAAFSLYEAALTAGDYTTLAAWIGQLRARLEKGRKKKKNA